MSTLLLEYILCFPLSWLLLSFLYFSVSRFISGFVLVHLLSTIFLRLLCFVRYFALGSPSLHTHHSLYVSSMGFCFVLPLFHAPPSRLSPLPQAQTRGSRHRDASTSTASPISLYPSIFNLSLRYLFHQDICSPLASLYEVDLIASIFSTVVTPFTSIRLLSSPTSPLHPYALFLPLSFFLSFFLPHLQSDIFRASLLSTFPSLFFYTSLERFDWFNFSFLSLVPMSVSLVSFRLFLCFFLPISKRMQRKSLSSLVFLLRMVLEMVSNARLPPSPLPFHSSVSLARGGGGVMSIPTSTSIVLVLPMVIAIAPVLSTSTVIVVYTATAASRVLLIFHFHFHCCSHMP